MGIFEQMDEHGHEQVAFLSHEGTGLQAIIAFHNTTRGPGLGGTRMRAYASEDEALTDALRLSWGMTAKAAAVDVDYGGAKCVVLGDPHKDKTPELMRALGRFVQGLRGRFYTGTDVGTYPQDFVHAARECDYIVGVPVEYGGSGDSSIPTAVGVMMGLRAVARHLWATDSLNGRTLAIQGVGKVGSKLAVEAAKAGARVIIADVDGAAVEQVAAQTGAQVVDVADILSADCDILAPCALGGAISDESIGALRCAAVCGSANNQLADERHGQRLHERGILYAPDYVVNAGGLLQVSDELHPSGPNPERVRLKTRAIYDILLAIFARSKERNIPTSEAADHLVAERIERTFGLRGIRTV